MIGRAPPEPTSASALREVDQPLLFAASFSLFLLVGVIAPDFSIDSCSSFVATYLCLDGLSNDLFNIELKSLSPPVYPSLSFFDKYNCGTFLFMCKSISLTSFGTLLILLSFLTFVIVLDSLSFPFLVCVVFAN